MKTPLRITHSFIATAAKRAGHVTIRSREPNVTPRQRTVRPQTWKQLNSYKDGTFDASCCWDLGIAAFLKTKV